MADIAIQQRQPDSPRDRVIEISKRFRWLFYSAVTVAVLAAITFRFWDKIEAKAANEVPFEFALMLSLVLAMLPALVCFVQGRSRRRQKERLASLHSPRLSRTALFRLALDAIDPARLVVDADYGIPLLVFTSVCFAGFAATLGAYSHAELFETPHAGVLLGGWKSPSAWDFAAYQAQTFVVVAMAFFGSYLSALSRVIGRVNNNDFYPISLYHYTARIVVACITAAVLRHSIEALGVVQKAIGNAWGPLLLLLAFSIGFAPDLFIVAMLRRAFQVMKTWGSRRDPIKTVRPTSMSLLMIDDITRDKIERLNELEIDTAQALARQNPFRLLPRLPYDLSLIVDWIAQAQLYVFARDVSLQKLRAPPTCATFSIYTSGSMTMRRGRSSASFWTLAMRLARRCWSS